MSGRRRWSTGAAWPPQEDVSPRHDGPVPEQVTAVGEEFPITSSLKKQKEGFYVLEGWCQLCSQSFRARGCVKATGKVERFGGHKKKLEQILHHAKTEHNLQGDWSVYRDVDAKDPWQRIIWSTDERKAAIADASAGTSLRKVSCATRAASAGQGAALPASEGPPQDPPLDDEAEGGPPAKRARTASCRLRADAPAKNPAADDDGQPADSPGADKRLPDECLKAFADVAMEDTPESKSTCAPKEGESDNQVVMTDSSENDRACSRSGDEDQRGLGDLASCRGRFVQAELPALEDAPPPLSPKDAGIAPSAATEPPQHARGKAEPEQMEGKTEVAELPVPSVTSKKGGSAPLAAEAEPQLPPEPLEMDVSPKVLGRAPLVVVPPGGPLPPRALLPKDAILRRQALLPEDALLKRLAWQALQRLEPEVFTTTVAEATAAGIEAPPAWPGLGVVPEELRTGFRSLLVVGPSGSGKTTLLRAILSELFPDYTGSIYPHGKWAPDLPLIDAFETAEEGRDLLSSVGICSVPSWCKPFSVLSVGEQYRANVALALQRRRQAPELPLVLDEWTSELDRDLARNVSLALGKRLRRESQEADGGRGPYIFATCHEDMICHLQPELICRCAVGVAPQVLRNPHAGAMPCLSSVLKGEPNHTEARSEGDWLCGPWAVEGTTSWFTIRPHTPIPGEFVVSNWGFTAIKVGNIRRSDYVQPGEETKEADAFPGPWYSNECEGSEWHMRLRLLSRDAMQLVHSYVDEGIPQEQEVKVARLQVLRHTQASLMARDRAKSPTTKLGYEDIDTSALERAGWYLPPEFQQDALYAGLQRSCEPLRVGSSDPFGDNDPDAEEQKYYLASYVGKAGYLSSKLYDVSRLLDCPFDGLCVHEVPNLPFFWEFSVGVITGPSGSGKSSLLRKLFGPCPRVAWTEEPVLAHFASLARARELCGAACLDLGVAMRPFGSLSAGEQARARLARLLDGALPAEEVRGGPLLLLEEFTSLLDRALAKRLARSIQRLVTTRGLQVVVASCHRDFIAAGLLEPEWVYECHSCRLLRFRTKASEIAESVSALRSSLAEARGAESRSEVALCRLQRQVAAASLSEEFRAEAAKFLESLGARELEQRREEIASLNQRIAEAYSEASAALPAADEAEDPGPEASLALAAPETLELQLVVRRALVCEWAHFKEHHYKDHKIKSDSVAFVGLIADRVACFIAIARDPMNFVHLAAAKKRLPEGVYPSSWLEANPARLIFREHRTVVLPDFQGMGLAPLLCDTVAAYVHRMGHDFTSQTIHPFYGGYRDRSPFWRPMHTNRRKGKAISGNLKYSHFFVGATQADGGEDPELRRQLAARAVLADGP